VIRRRGLLDDVVALGRAVMKLASYLVNGKEVFGVVVGDGVITMNERLGEKYASLRDVLADFALDEMHDAALGATPDQKLADLKLLPPIPRPEKILCVGINYKSHAAEHGQEAPKLPNIFTRFVDTLVGPGGNMIRPKVSTNLDFEGELAVVIGRGPPERWNGRHIPPGRALEYVGGYTCFCDGSCATSQNIRWSRARILSAPVRSVRGSSPPMKSLTQAS